MPLNPQHTDVHRPRWSTMATDQSLVDHLCEQASLGSALTFKRMFGEFALYLKVRVVAFVCDN
jgi:TfoX/Sxy family transcriptional regulator of competence genes